MSRHLAEPRHERTPTAARRSHWPSTTAVTGGLHRQRMCECGVLVVTCQERIPGLLSLNPWHVDASQADQQEKRRRRHPEMRA